MPSDKPATAALALKHGKHGRKRDKNGRHDKKHVLSDKPATVASALKNVQHDKKHVLTVHSRRQADGLRSVA